MKTPPSLPAATAAILPPTLKGNIMKTTFATATLSACLALGAFPAFAAGTMGQDATGMDKTPMSGQAMHKDGMGASQAPMAKEDKAHGSAMDHMGKKGMEKDAMGKDGMKKDNMQKMDKDGMKK